MSKNKLAKFAEMETFANVLQNPVKGSELFTTDAPVKGRWNREFFHNDNPIVLELGCGRGEYTVGLARQYGDKNFVGVDIKGARMYHGAKAALAEGLGNVAFLRTNIEFIGRFFAENEVSEIWITFCDPQMKKATKRLTSTYFLERYRKMLVDGGLIHLKTDSNFLFTYTVEMLRASGIEPQVVTRDLYGEHPGNVPGQLYDIKTCYEQQWLSRGLNIKYLRFALPRAGVLVEPDVEIEKDTYRSVGARSAKEPLNS